ncbi:MAG: transposase [Sphingobacteriales bacterium]|nr:transposase [Sphingobacteriales bacterium]
MAYHGCYPDNAALSGSQRPVLKSGYIHADGTTIRVQDSSKKAYLNGSSGRGATHQGYYWSIRVMKKLVLFDYRTGRSREGPQSILKDYQGYLQTDARLTDASRAGLPGL